MKFKATISILPQDALLDPQGKAVQAGLAGLGLAAIADVRIGRFARLLVDAESEETAREIVEQACNKLLVNAIMEQYSYELEVLPA